MITEVVRCHGNDILKPHLIEALLAQGPTVLS